jgi:hypothetical protein
MTGNRKYNAKREALFVNIIDVFNTDYGTNDTTLGSWQKLCEDVGVTVGGSLTQCKKVLHNVMIALEDGL